MADSDSNKCGLCGAELETGSDVCPNCGADLSLLDLEDGEGLEAIKQSASLDDLLATVLDEPGMASSKEEKSEKPFDDLDLDLDIPDEPVEKPKLDLDVLEEGSSTETEAEASAGPPLEPDHDPSTARETGVLDETPTVADLREVEPLSVTEDIQQEQEELTYECPECGAKVAESAAMCFSCGALFSEETLACPECGTEVVAGTPQCPRCGVQFVPEEVAIATAPSFTPESPAPAPAPAPVTRPAPRASGHIVSTVLDRYETLERQPFSPSQNPVELQRSLKEYVTYLRGLLILAKSVRVPTESIQLKVADATKRAKAHDLEGAVRMAHSAKMALEQTLSLQIAKRLEMLQADLETNRSRGIAHPVAEDLVRRAVADLEAGRVQGAYEGMERAREDVAASSGSQTDARSALQTAKEMVDEVAPLGLGDGELRSLLAEGEKALQEGNWETAAQMASSVQARATETLQDGLSGEMKRMREKVMQLKIQGQDVSRPISLLKQAGASIKEKSYEDALRYLNLIKQDIQM
ncbi:MAG: zinc ribbon domain-containing protein [Thermoplasmata archaeon]